MAAKSPDDVWKARNERAATFTPHDTWSHRIANIEGPSTIENSRDICDSVWFLFGPVAALRSMSVGSQETFTEWVNKTLSRYERAGVLPRQRNIASTFSLVTMPVWSAWYEPEIEEDVVDSFVAARPRWGDNVEVAQVDARLASGVWDLVNMGIKPGMVYGNLFKLVGLTELIRFSGSKFWEFFCAFYSKMDDDNSPLEKPIIDDFFFAIPDNEKPRDERPKYITTVNVIYDKMTASQRAKLSERMTGDHIFLHPPASKTFTLPPRAIPERICAERRRWMQATYGLFVNQFIVYTLNLAHLIYLNEFFPKNLIKPPIPRQFVRARAKIIDIFMAKYEAGIRKNVLADLYADLTSPSLAYTRPVCMEEVRGWLLHAFELEYVRDIVRKKQAGISSEKTAGLCRTYSDNAMTIDDIVATLFIHNIQLSEQWLDTVLNDWGLLHPDDYILSDNHQTRDDAPAAWLRQLKSLLKKHQLIGTERPPASINVHLNLIMRICTARFFLYCYHEKKSNVTSPKKMERMRASFEEYMHEAMFYKYHEHTTSKVASHDALNKLFRHVFIPCFNRCPNPMRLNNMLDGKFLEWPTRPRDLFVKTSITPENNDPNIWLFKVNRTHFPWHSRHGNALVRSAIRLYRNNITCFNWYERFYENWAIPNESSIVGGISYVAQLDDLETQAHNLHLYTRGFIHTTTVKIKAKEFESSIIHVAVNDWPRYKQWKTVRVYWRAFHLDNSDEQAFIYEYSVQGSVFYPIELAGSIILEKFRSKGNATKRGVAEISIECKVEGTYVMSKRIARDESTMNTLSVEASCIVIIPDF